MPATDSLPAVPDAGRPRPQAAETRPSGTGFGDQLAQAQAQAQAQASADAAGTSAAPAGSAPPPSAAPLPIGQPMPANAKVGPDTPLPDGTPPTVETPSLSAITPEKASTAAIDEALVEPSSDATHAEEPLLDALDAMVAVPALSVEPAPQPSPATAPLVAAAPTSAADQVPQAAAAGAAPDRTMSAETIDVNGQRLTGTAGPDDVSREIATAAADSGAPIRAGSEIAGPGELAAPPPAVPSPEPAGLPTAPSASAAPASTAAAEPPQSLPSRPAPAAQVAPAFDTPEFKALVSAPPATDGVRRLVVRLDPVELGEVEIRVERPPSGPARVELTVGRPDTLLLLLRDQAQLNAALDQAGVPPEGRTLEFQLSPARADTGGQAQDASSGGSWGHRGNGEGRRDGGRGWQQPGGSAAVAASTLHQASWRNAGIDITA